MQATLIMATTETARIEPRQAVGHPSRGDSEAQVTRGSVSGTPRVPWNGAEASTVGLEVFSSWKRNCSRKDLGWMQEGLPPAGMSHRSPCPPGRGGVMVTWLPTALGASFCPTLCSLGPWLRGPGSPVCGPVVRKPAGPPTCCLCCCRPPRSAPLWEEGAVPPPLRLQGPAVSRPRHPPRYRERGAERSRRRVHARTPPRGEGRACPWAEAWIGLCTRSLELVLPAPSADTRGGDSSQGGQAAGSGWTPRWGPGHPGSPGPGPAACPAGGPVPACLPGPEPPGHWAEPVWGLSSLCQADAAPGRGTEESSEPLPPGALGRCFPGGVQCGRRRPVLVTRSRLAAWCRVTPGSDLLSPSCPPPPVTRRRLASQASREAWSGQEEAGFPPAVPGPQARWDLGGCLGAPRERGCGSRLRGRVEGPARAWMPPGQSPTAGRWATAAGALTRRPPQQPSVPHKRWGGKSSSPLTSLPQTVPSWPESSGGRGDVPVPPHKLGLSVRRMCSRRGPRALGGH